MVYPFISSLKPKAESSINISPFYPVTYQVLLISSQRILGLSCAIHSRCHHLNWSGPHFFLGLLLWTPQSPCGQHRPLVIHSPNSSHFACLLPFQGFSAYRATSQTLSHIPGYPQLPTELNLKSSPLSRMPFFPSIFLMNELEFTCLSGLPLKDFPLSEVVMPPYSSKQLKVFLLCSHIGFISILYTTSLRFKVFILI